MTEVKDESDKFLSTAYALMGLAGLILIVILGNISDRYGTKKTLIAGSFLLILKFLLLFAFENIYWQILFFLIPGAFASILINQTIESGIKQSTAKNYRTLAISLYWSITALASMFAGFAISIFIVFGDKTQSTFNLLFLFCAGMGAVAFILALFLEGPKTQNLTEEETRLKEQKKLTGWEHTRQVLILKNF